MLLVNESSSNRYMLGGRSKGKPALNSAEDSKTRTPNICLQQITDLDGVRMGQNWKQLTYTKKREEMEEARKKNWGGGTPYSTLLSADGIPFNLPGKGESKRREGEMSGVVNFVNHGALIANPGLMYQLTGPEE